jgi:hypothetical protein
LQQGVIVWHLNPDWFTLNLHSETHHGFLERLDAIVCKIVVSIGIGEYPLFLVKTKRLRYFHFHLLEIFEWSLLVTELKLRFWKQGSLDVVD